MDTETLWNTPFGKVIIRLLASIMESRLRYLLWGPAKILEGAGLAKGLNILEVGCGTGYYTLPAVAIVGEEGHVTAIDVLNKSVDLVAEKIAARKLENVTVFQRNALETKFEDSKFDEVLLFGVIPAPMLPMDQLMKEMHRVLKPNGLLAVWPPSWVMKEISFLGYFQFLHKKNGVYIFQKTTADTTDSSI